MQACKTNAALAIRIAVCLAWACIAPSGAMAQRDLGFGFCAPPFPPKCVANPATYHAQADIDKCQEEVNRYLNYVGAYRVCQTQEIERAVRETNGTLQRWKCGLATRALCP
jgi:hypothetical protein